MAKSTHDEQKNEDPIFETLLDYLRQARGFDFTGYKRSSLQRRVRKEMQSHTITTYEDYLDYLQVHPEEFLPLFNTILINVTSFFRDATAWQYFQAQALPNLLNEKPPNEPIRIWSIGCASGQEAYTLAMILAEALGLESYRQRVKIYATDVDEEALIQARRAIYTTKDLRPIPPALQKRYFEPVGEHYAFRPDIRRTVIFGRHDLLQDAPISRLDLLVCRNTLMYFNAETQAKILARFHFALSDTGLLFLGKAEMLLTHAHLFAPISLQHRIFQRISKLSHHQRFQLPTLAEDNKDRATGLHVGRPLQDLEVSYRPLELRSHLEQVYRDLKSVTVKDVSRQRKRSGPQYLDIQIIPLEDANRELIGASITFTEVTYRHTLQEELQESTQTLETTNEELQSSNEKLETTNEELQSTNEELETTNEELQSTNEELQTINDELHLRTGELNQTNAFLNSILSSLQAGVIVLDRQFEILKLESPGGKSVGTAV